MASKRKLALKDFIGIIRLRLSRFSIFSQREDIVQIKGVPVNIIGNIKRNQDVVEQVKERFSELDKNFESLILLTAGALRAVGKYLETDIYLERSILEGAREQDAYRYFLVTRQEVDRAILMMIFNRGQIETLKSHKRKNTLSRPSICEKSRLNDLGSVIDNDYSSATLQQVECYFDILFHEETIIHLLGNTKKIVNILRLPYELPSDVYKREPYSTNSPCSLTELILPQNV